MVKIVLTADRAVFTDYHGADLFGFGLCMPYRLVPKFVEYMVLAPRAPTVDGVRARFAPLGICKTEAALLAAGFKREEVAIVPPHALRKAVDKDTAIVAVHVLDPKGLAPVTWTLKAISGGGTSCTELEFENLMKVVLELKHRYRFKLVVGGPGSWQLRGWEDKYEIDVLYDGESELTFPIVVKKLLNGEEVPRYVRGEPPPPEAIPLIVTPSRNGQVQITRGCPRRCRFCSPTMWRFRSIPLEQILKEVKFNLDAGFKSVGFVTEDVLLYGANGLKLNPDAIKKLFDETVKLASKYGVDTVGFSHVSCASALVVKDVVKYISDLEGLSDSKPLFPQIGLESGSPRIVAKYFRGKAYPWSPEDWPNVIVEASKLFNDAYWYPCYTYIIGFPDATPDDYIKTIELLDRLRDEGFKGWTFPLLLIPMGGTLIEKEAQFLQLKKLPREAIDCLVEGWRLSLSFSRTIIHRLVRVRNPLIAKILNRLAEKALRAMEVWIDGVSKGIDIIETQFSQVNIRNLSSLAKTIVSVVAHPKKPVRATNA
ncbi:MAG: B12-binding domain-containing radical SAM protein [Crenarchaeota archaeon]|nr:B12-binding domain-containing radical SAM protein [Thermoproteota archaeon]